MAKYFYHEFTAESSAMVLVAFIALVVLALICGKNSVKVRPLRLPKGGVSRRELWPDEPHFRAYKAMRVRKNYRYSLSNYEIADSVITLCSQSRDMAVSAAGGVFYAWLFAYHHYDGMVQWVINHANPNNAAIVGDLAAAIALVLIAGLVAIGLYLARMFAQFRQADRLVAHYVFELRRAPLIRETPTVRFICEHSVWAIRQYSADVREKEEDSAAHDELA